MFLSRFWPLFGGNIPGVCVYSRKKPTKAIIDDIVYAFTVSAHLKDFGAGRTVVVKRKTIMAAESAEGIEDTVKRGCMLGRKDATVIISNSQALITADVLKILKEYKGKTLAILKDGVKIEDFDSFVRFADELGLIFLAFEGEKFYNAKLFEEQLPLCGGL